MAKANLRNFNPQLIAKYDAEMWRAYYNHQFFKLFSQLLLLIKNQLGLNWFNTFRLAYYSAWAAADYRIHKQKGVNNARVVKNLVQFYKVISSHATVPFDYKQAGKLELIWWDIHRHSRQNNDQLEQSIAAAGAAMFNIDPARLKDYGHYRAVAMILPRHEGDAQHTPTDWAYTTELLTNAWSDLHKVVNAEK